MRSNLRTIIRNVIVLMILAAVALPCVVAQNYNYNNQYDPYNQYGNQYGNQYNRNNQNVGLDPYSMDPSAMYYDEENEGQPQDSTPPKVRKPLESYFFDDSTRLRPNFVWNVNTKYNRIEFTDIDTMLYDSQTYYPFHKKGVGDAYQGNLGGASIPLNYFDRPNYNSHEFAQAFDTYYFTPENARFFNVKKPFTQFTYYWGGQKKYLEENLAVTHAQNISPSSGFNLDYKSRGTRGIYNHQKGRAKNLSLAFSHTGKQYSVHAGYIYNAIINKENGGIVDERHVTDTILELPENIPTHLNDARNTIKNNTYYLVQSYGFPLRRLTENDFSIADRSTIYVGHSTVYNRWARLYTDTFTGSNYSTDLSGGNDPNSIHNYYDSWNIDPYETRDSIFESSLQNRIFIQLQPFGRESVISTIDGGVGMENYTFYHASADQYLTGKMAKNTQTRYYVYGSASGKIKKYFDWEGDLTYHPTGDLSGDMNIGAKASGNIYIKKRPLTVSAQVIHDRRSPGYWTENYFSNHFIWNKSFDKEVETRLEGHISMPSSALEVGIYQSVISDKIYYASDRLPYQFGGDITVSGLYVQKDFRFGGLHLNHRVLLQWSSEQEIIPVPKASAFLAYYFEFNVVKNVLRMQLGADCRVHSRYYAYGYEPSTSIFYTQQEKKVGDYPMIDAFVSAKWKRMRILLKMQHLNDDMFGSRNYFTLPNYPLNRRVLKMGISWTFYD